MFGTSTNGAGMGVPGGGRPAAAEVARVEGNLTHIIVPPEKGESVQVFVNAHPIPFGELESLSLTIQAPDERGANGTLTGIVSRYQTAAGGERVQRSGSLFPGTVELIARGRRLVVTCQQEGSFEGLWLGLGMRADGTTTELTGVQALSVVVTPTLLDARLTWSEDGREEDLLPEA